MLNFHFYFMQRLTALLMAPFVIVHIILMIYAIQGGLSAAEILGRTQGSIAWALFYGMFVITAAIHASIGVRVIAHEWLGLKGMPLSALTFASLALLLITGLRAVYAVTIP